MAVALREILAFFDVQWNASSLEDGGKAVDGAVDKLKKLGAVVASSAIVVGLKNVVSELQAQGDSLGKTSAQLGLATDDLQAYRHAANLASVANEQFDQSLRTLQRNQDAAAKGGAEQAASFKSLGIDVEVTKGKLKTLDQLLPELADGLMRIESPAERSALAQKLLGDAGARLLPMFSQGAAGLEAARKEIERLGGGITSDVVKDLEEMGDAETRLNVGLTSLKVQLAKGVFPILTSFAERLAYGLGRLSRFTAGIRETIKGSNILTGTFTVLGAAGVGKLFTLAGGWRGIGRLIMQATRVLGIFLLRLALPALLIDELITTWQGGDTIIRRILDGWFGEGRTAQIVGFFKLLAGGWENLVFVVDNVALMVGAIVVGLGAEIESVFATAWANVQDGTAEVWNTILATITETIGKIAALIDGASTKASELAGKFGLDGLAKWIKETGSGLAKGVADGGAGLAGAAAQGGNAARVEQEYWTKRTERVETFDRAKGAIGDRIASLSAPTTINVNVPPGTPASMAERTARATGQAVQKSRKATHAALKHQVD